MKSHFNIGQIADLVNVPSSTLRFWEDEKIYAVKKNRANNYREYSIYDLITIADVYFYRNLGVSVSDLKNFKFIRLEKMQTILASLKISLEAEIQRKQATLDNILAKQKLISEISSLRNVDYIYEDIPFKKVVSFEYTEKKKLEKYIENTSRYIKFQYSDCLDTEIRGIIVDSDLESQNVLWEYQKGQRYAAFLVEEIASENYVNNIKEKIAIINRKYKTGAILASFILSCTYQGKQIDFLKAYVQLLD